jgi:hypothetical protein
MRIYLGILNARVKLINSKRDNANIDGERFMGKTFQFGSEGSKEFAKKLSDKTETCTTLN